MKLFHTLTMAIPALSLVALSATPATAALTAAPGTSSTASPDMTAFPPAPDGQARHVIRLPQHGDEQDLKVELVVGKTMEIDCNHHAFGGKIEERTAEGWGYSYYVLESLGTGVSTMKGCPSNAKQTAFVRSSDETLVRYNSRLPLVVYAPSGVEVRYRIWRADKEQPAS